MLQASQTFVGVDSWTPATQEAIDLLKQISGFKFWGFYVGGADLYLQTPWPQTSIDLLKANEIEPLPIWVPKQDCSEDPETQASLAVQACIARGVYGVAAVDSEHSMSTALNFQAWLDRFCARVVQLGWLPVTYAGAHYVGHGSFAWNVAWGEPDRVPLPAEGLQTGPYDLKNSQGVTVIHVDGDHCDEHFPLASWSSSTSIPASVIPDAQPVPQPKPTQGGFTLQMPVLSVTSPGPNVVSEPARALQTLLNLRHNAALIADGRYGPRTAAAVTAWEEAAHIAVDDGIAGPQVWETLLGVPLG